MSEIPLYKNDCSRQFTLTISHTPIATKIVRSDAPNENPLYDIYVPDDLPVKIEVNNGILTITRVR